VTVALALLAYGACVGTLGARLLGRARWTARAPLLGIVIYLAAGWSVVAALGLAGLTLAVHATALGGSLSQVIGACVRRLRDLYAAPGGAAVAELGLILAGAVLARTALTAFGHLRASGRQALRHAHSARLAGSLEPALGAVVVEHPQPAAFCVAGRCPTVVVTSGAMAALEPGQLDAVLAHERAHLAGRHHALEAAARIGRQVLPFLRCCATPKHRWRAWQNCMPTTARPAPPIPGSWPLPWSCSPPPAQSTPAPTLAAAATDAVQRIHRLLGPAEPLGRVRRHLLRATAAILALAPVLVALSPAVAALALGRVPAAQQGARPRRPRRRVTGRVTVVRRVYRRPAASRRPSQ
jgi:Peptidase family M48